MPFSDMGQMPSEFICKKHLVNVSSHFHLRICHIYQKPRKQSFERAFADVWTNVLSVLSVLQIWSRYKRNPPGWRVECRCVRSQRESSSGAMSSCSSLKALPWRPTCAALFFTTLLRFLSCLQQILHFWCLEQTQTITLQFQRLNGLEITRITPGFDTFEPKKKPVIKVICCFKVFNKNIAHSGNELPQFLGFLLIV